MLLSHHDKRATILSTVILPPTDVGPSIITPDRVQLSFRTLGETPVEGTPVDVCCVADRLLVLCDHSMHLFLIDANGLVETCAASVPAKAKSALRVGSSSSFVVAHSTCTTAYRALIDESSSVAELVPQWEWQTEGRLLAPAAFTPYSVSWLRVTGAASVQLVVGDASAEVSPSGNTLCEMLLVDSTDRPATAALHLCSSNKVVLGYTSGQLAQVSFDELGCGQQLQKPLLAQRTFTSAVETIWTITIEAQEIILATSKSGQVGLWHAA